MFLIDSRFVLNDEFLMSTLSRCYRAIAENGVDSVRADQLFQSITIDKMKLKLC